MYKSITEVIGDSLKVEDKMREFKGDKARVIKYVTRTTNFFAKKNVYCIKDGVIAFIVNGNFYVTPLRRDAFERITKKCKKSKFKVPFTEGYQPYSDYFWGYLQTL